MSKGTINKVILIGRLGRDPEMRYTSSGTAVVNFSMATNHTIRSQEGDNTEQTEWHKVVAFGRTAEVAGEYLTKGRLVYIEGRLQTSSWEDKEGQKRYKTEVICSNMQLLGGRGDTDSGGDEKTQEVTESAETETKTDAETPAAKEEEDDLPF